MNSLKLWILASFGFLVILILLEIHYEDYAKNWESHVVSRELSIFETPGFIVNKYALMIYGYMAKDNNYTIWNYPVRVLITLFYIFLAIILGFVVSLLLAKDKRLWGKFPQSRSGSKRGPKHRS